MRILAVVLLALLLAGCETTQPTLVTQKLVLAEPPSTLFRCQEARKGLYPLPDSRTLTDLQVAQLLRKYQSVVDKCGSSEEAVQAWIKNAKKRVER